MKSFKEADIMVEEELIEKSINDANFQLPSNFGVVNLPIYNPILNSEADGFNGYIENQSRIGEASSA